MNTKLLFISFVFALNGYSQTTSFVQDSARQNASKHQFFIGGSFGACAPIVENGSPSSININKNFAYVTSCKYFDVNFNYVVSKHFGLMLQYDGTIRSLDKSFSNPYYSLETNGGTYYVGEAKAGPFYYLSFKNRIVLETYLLVGATNFHQTAISGTEYYNPEVHFLNQWYTPPTPFTIPVYNTIGICSELGLKIKIRVVKNLYATVHLSYTQSFSGGYY